MKTVRTLLVEDVQDDALLLLHELRRAGYDPESRRIQSAAEVAVELHSADWDLVCADYSTPLFSVAALPGGALTVQSNRGVGTRVPACILQRGEGLT